MRHYADFAIRITREGNGYRARVLEEGKAQTFSLDVPALFERWRHFAEAFTGQAGAPEAIHEAESLGGELFRAVFTDQILRAWGAARAPAERGLGDGIRLVLRLEEAGPLANLPWELL